MVRMISAFFLPFFALHAVHCFDNYYWYNNPAVNQAPAPRNPFLTYDANDRPSLEKYTGVRYSQAELLADQPLLRTENRRIGGVVKTNNGFVLPPNDVPASLKNSPSQQRAKPPQVVARQFENAADWPTPPPIVGGDGADSNPSPVRRRGATAASGAAPQPILADDSSITAPNDSFKALASAANADSQPPPPPRSPFATAKDSSATKAEENAAAEDAGFVLPPPIPTGDSAPEKFLSLKESERDFDHFQFKKFDHNTNDDGEKSSDFQFEALNDQPLSDKRLFSSNDDDQSSSSAQLFGRLLRNRDRFAYLYAHLNDFLRRRKRQTSGSADAAASQPSVNLPPSSLPGLGPEKPFQPPVNQQPDFASSFPNTNGRTVLGPQSGIPDVGERKVLLPTDANNQQNVLMKATGPVNEGKIFLPQHTQAAQQAVALASPQQPALNPSGGQLAAKAAPVQQSSAVDGPGAGRVVLLNTRPINGTKSSKKKSSSTTTLRPGHKKKKKGKSNVDEGENQGNADQPSSNSNPKVQQDSHPQGKIYLPKDRP